MSACISISLTPTQGPFTALFMHWHIPINFQRAYHKPLLTVRGWRMSQHGLCVTR